jgi:hypothetical protein
MPGISSEAKRRSVVQSKKRGLVGKNPNAISDAYAFEPGFDTRSEADREQQAFGCALDILKRATTD